MALHFFWLLADGGSNNGDHGERSVGASLGPASL